MTDAFRYLLETSLKAFIFIFTVLNYPTISFYKLVSDKSLCLEVLAKMFIAVWIPLLRSCTKTIMGLTTLEKNMHFILVHSVKRFEI